MSTVATQELDALVRREHFNPHSILGAHVTDEGLVIRALRPAASEVKAQLQDGSVVELEQIHPGGIFEGVVTAAKPPIRYRLMVDYGAAGTFTIDDPYAFSPTLGELDIHLIGEGRHEELYEKLGAHVRDHEGVVCGSQHSERRRPADRWARRSAADAAARLRGAATL